MRTHAGISAPYCPGHGEAARLDSCAQKLQRPVVRRGDRVVERGEFRSLEEADREATLRA